MSPCRAFVHPCTLVLLLGGACGPPSERLTRITSDRAPLLANPDDQGLPIEIVGAGELVHVEHSVRPSARWSGSIEGTEASRRGELVQVKRGSGEASNYAFRSDLGEEVSAPTAEWLCRRMQGPRECAGRLHRTAIPGGVVAWEGCFAGPCRVMLARGRVVSAPIFIEGLTDLRVARVQEQVVAMATTRWARQDGAGSTMLVLRLGEVIKRSLEIPLEQEVVDHLTVKAREGRVSTADDGLHFRGKQHIRARSGAEISVSEVNETYHLAPAAKR